VLGEWVYRRERALLAESLGHHPGPASFYTPKIACAYGRIIRDAVPGQSVGQNAEHRSTTSLKVSEAEAKDIRNSVTRGHSDKSKLARIKDYLERERLNDGIKEGRLANVTAHQVWAGDFSSHLHKLRGESRIRKSARATRENPPEGGKGSRRQAIRVRHRQGWEHKQGHKKG
jgi:hypothetical protein